MLKNISVKDLQQAIALDHPFWDSAAARNQAEEYIATIDERLEEPLRLFLCENRKTDFSHGEFSILMIQSFCRCSYVDAVVLMDAYLKDPRNGKAMILRRN